MRKILQASCAAVLAFVSVSLRAQAPEKAEERSDKPQQQNSPQPLKQDVVVTGTWSPVPLEEADRVVNAYPVRNQVVLFGSFADALQLDSSVQVQSRTPNGVQGDLSIRGGTFAQTLVLLNGIRLSDAQSAHHTMDIPVPLDAIDRMEVLRGSGSTLYGSEAVSGVVNVLTRPEAKSGDLEMRVRGGYGSFGTNEQSGFLAFRAATLTQRFSFERELSTGFRDNRDYRNLALSSETWAKTKLGLTRAFLSILDRPFGAENFYGLYPSWERTKTWLATLSQDLGDNTIFSLGYRRHTDLYELYRTRPDDYTNRHEDETWDVALRRHDRLGPSGTIYYGLEGLADRVESTNLGMHSRQRGAVYGSYDVRSLRRLSLNIGGREEFYGAGGTIFAPSISAGYWLTSTVKVRAAYSQAFRLPNYTDLFYHDPANVGDPNLKPEKSSNYEGGADWHPGRRVRTSFTLFQRRERDGIDYIRANPADIWRATNFSRLHFSGWEATVALSLPSQQKVELQYTGLHGAEAVLGNYQSKYVFNYPKQSAIFTWQGSSNRGWLARLRVGATQQIGRDPYTLIDLYGAWTRSRIHPYVRLTNLTNAYYEPFIGVAMPGRAAFAGVELCVFCRGD